MIMKHLTLIFALTFVCICGMAQVSIPPAKMEAHPDYAAYQRAKQAKDYNAALRAGANLIEIYPGNSLAFDMISSAFYSSNKPQDAVDFSKWAVAYNAYDGAGSYYGFIRSVFANQPQEAEKFLRNMQLR